MNNILNSVMQYVFLGFIPQLQAVHGWELVHELASFQIEAGSVKEIRAEGSEILYLVSASEGISIRSPSGEYNPNNSDISQAKLDFTGLLTIENTSPENGNALFVRILRIA